MIGEEEGTEVEVEKAEEIAAGAVIAEIEEEMGIADGDPKRLCVFLT